MPDPDDLTALGWTEIGATDDPDDYQPEFTGSQALIAPGFPVVLLDADGRVTGTADEIEFRWDGHPACDAERP